MFNLVEFSNLTILLSETLGCLWLGNFLTVQQNYKFRTEGIPRPNPIVTAILQSSSQRRKLGEPVGLHPLRARVPAAQKSRCFVVRHKENCLQKCQGTILENTPQNWCLVNSDLYFLDCGRRFRWRWKRPRRRWLAQKSCVKRTRNHWRTCIQSSRNWKQRRRWRRLRKAQKSNSKMRLIKQMYFCLNSVCWTHLLNKLLFARQDFIRVFFLRLFPYYRQKNVKKFHLVIWRIFRSCSLEGFVTVPKLLR